MHQELSLETVLKPPKDDRQTNTQKRNTCDVYKSSRTTSKVRISRRRIQTHPRFEVEGCGDVIDEVPVLLSGRAAFTFDGQEVSPPVVPVLGQLDQLQSGVRV